MVKTDMSNILMSSEDDAKEKQNSIVVPMDDLDTVSSDSPDTVEGPLLGYRRRPLCRKNTRLVRL